MGSNFSLDDEKFSQNASASSSSSSDSTTSDAKSMNWIEYMNHFDDPADANMTYTHIDYNRLFQSVKYMQSVEYDDALVERRRRIRYVRRQFENKVNINDIFWKKSAVDVDEQWVWTTVEQVRSLFKSKSSQFGEKLDKHHADFFRIQNDISVGFLSTLLLGPMYKKNPKDFVEKLRRIQDIEMGRAQRQSSVGDTSIYYFDYFEEEGESNQNLNLKNLQEKYPFDFFILDSYACAANVLLWPEKQQTNSDFCMSTPGLDLLFVGTESEEGLYVSPNQKGRKEDKYYATFKIKFKEAFEEIRKMIDGINKGNGVFSLQPIATCMWFLAQSLPMGIRTLAIIDIFFAGLCSFLLPQDFKDWNALEGKDVELPYMMTLYCIGLPLGTFVDIFPRFVYGVEGYNSMLEFYNSIFKAVAEYLQAKGGRMPQAEIKAPIGRLNNEIPPSVGDVLNEFERDLKNELMRRAFHESVISQRQKLFSSSHSQDEILKSSWDALVGQFDVDINEPIQLLLKNLQENLIQAMSRHAIMQARRDLDEESEQYMEMTAVLQVLIEGTVKKLVGFGPFDNIIKEDEYSIRNIIKTFFTPVPGTIESLIPGSQHYMIDTKLLENGYQIMGSDLRTPDTETLAAAKANYPKIATAVNDRIILPTITQLNAFYESKMQ